MARTFDYVYDLDMKIGEKHIYGNFISMDIGSIVTSIRNKTGMTISGIIGSDKMKNYCFIIDFEKEEILLKSGLHKHFTSINIQPAVKNSHLCAVLISTKTSLLIIA